MATHRSPSDTIVNAKIKDKEGYDSPSPLVSCGLWCELEVVGVGAARLNFAGRQLEDGCKLSDSETLL